MTSENLTGIIIVGFILAIGLILIGVTLYDYHYINPLNHILWK
jgi:hypothetical protein